MANYKQVSYGSQGSDVTELQKLLNNNGYNLTVDGIFGSQTQKAVQEYQKKSGLSVDGIVGKNTWGALTKATSGDTKPTSTTGTKPTSTTGSNPAPSNFQYQGYKESDTVKQAEAMLQQQMANKPGAYTSPWQSQLNDIIDRISNREKFSYDLNGDALYQQYKDQYMTQGQMAMMDTMGHAQAMTGGYGNSYAQTAGQQTYQGYLQQLNDRVPELYQLALNQYNQEGQDLYNQYGMLADQEEQDYGRYRDQVGDYYTEMDRLYDQYNTERDFDYGKWVDDRNLNYDNFWNEKNFAYEQERDKIADKQWQAEFDEAKRRYDQAWEQQYGDDSDKSSGGGSGGNGGNNNTGNKNNTSKNDTTVKNPASIVTGFDSGDSNVLPFTGSTYEQAVAYMEKNGVSSANACGVMTQSEWSRRQSSYQSFGTGGAEVKNYNSYQAYLRDYCAYQVEQSGGGRK